MRITDPAASDTTNRVAIGAERIHRGSRYEAPQSRLHWAREAAGSATRRLFAELHMHCANPSVFQEDSCADRNLDH
jgi:hypothetical protein